MSNYIEVYTDGACSGNPGPSGAGIFIRYNSAEKRISKFLGHGTNNIAELTAIKIALEQMKSYDIPIKLFTDSQYSIGVLTKNWKAKINVELINHIKNIMLMFKDLQFLYIEGHKNNHGNEIADQLAVLGSNKIDSEVTNYEAISSAKTTEMDNGIICFHHKDHDGFCSAAVVAKKYPTCDKFYPISYNNSIPWELIFPNMKVIIVDFSFKPEDLDKLLSITSDVIWIDHHKTAMEKTPLTSNELAGLRVDGTAACVLCWEYFFPNQAMPLAIQYVGDRDVWTFQYGDLTKNFYHGLESINDVNKPASEFWKELLSSPELTNSLVEKGKVIREAFDKDQLLFIKSNNFKTVFDGRVAICVNRYLNQDLVYDVVSDPFDMIIMFYHTGKQWYYSLRSKTIDVSEIAKKYGGGGHEGAAGIYLKEFIISLPE